MQQSLDIQHAIDAIDCYLLSYETHPATAENLLSSNSPYQALLSSHFKPANASLKKWQEADYERLTDHPEALIHKTFSGHFVRSKSEVLIDTALSKHKIPFRYECALSLEDFVVYPDFTIRHPKTDEIFYWEHFGMMDNSNYANHAYSKISKYIANGILPGVQLITTYETQSSPLTTDIIERTINAFF